jgi:hypothetical protein
MSFHRRSLWHWEIGSVRSISNQFRRRRIWEFKLASLEGGIAGGEVKKEVTWIERGCPDKVAGLRSAEGRGEG